jgi:hypothetical protein
MSPHKSTAKSHPASAFWNEPRRAEEIQVVIGLKHRQTFRENYLNKYLAQGFIERTIPEKPRSRLQRYRLTEKGRAWLAAEAMASKNDRGSYTGRHARQRTGTPRQPQG